MTKIEEEGIANVGANVAGMGQGPDGEPGMPKDKMKKKVRSLLLKRKIKNNP